MEIFQLISNRFTDWIQVFKTPSGAWQLLIIFLALAISWFVHRRWQKFIVDRIGEHEATGIRRFALRGSGRVVFPLTMAAFLLVGRGVLAQFFSSTALLDVLLPLIFSLALIRITVYTLRRVYGSSQTLRALEGFVGLSVWFVVALHLLGWLPDVLAALDRPAIIFGSNRFSVLSLFKFTLAAAVFIVLARWTSRLIEQRVQHSTALSATMQIGLAKFSRVLLYTLAILIALGSVGIDLTTLTVFSGALGVGLGFGLQRIASNFISGFILIFDRSIKPGDVISIGNRFGWVVALHARYIVVRDRDGVETLIPNENLITSEVINWSYSDRHIRIKIPVQISYSDNPEQAMEIMLNACLVNKRVLSEPVPQVRLPNVRMSASSASERAGCPACWSSAPGARLVPARAAGSSRRCRAA